VVRLTAEIEVPDDALAVRVHLEKLCRESGWRLLSLGRTGEPPCPACGSPMVYSRELQAYACSHPE
jgi:hypothetical protein